MGKTSLLVFVMIATVLLPAPALVEQALAEDHEVRPGDRMVIGSRSCTVSFLFDGQGDREGEVYFSTAAHCVIAGVGAAVNINGIADFAEVAWIHPDWQNGIIESDMALLRVHPANHGHVQAAVRGHDASPTGVATSEDTHLGDIVQFSGYGTGFTMHQKTREERFGFFWDSTGPTFVVEGPITPGDSGGPVLHEPTGKAIGINSVIAGGCCNGPGHWVEGPNVHHLITQATANGFEIGLRTA